MLNVLSLFSGIGAFEKALDNLGIEYKLLGYCEIDKYASKAYSLIHNVPESMNYTDVTKIDDLDFIDEDIDLITYGFPCQDISLAGKQKGFTDEEGKTTRSGLFFEALRIIEDYKPKYAIAENVKNLTSKKFSKEFSIVLDSLEKAGYRNYWKVLNAKDYGIPQNREREYLSFLSEKILIKILYFRKKYLSSSDLRIYWRIASIRNISLAKSQSRAISSTENGKRLKVTVSVLNRERERESRDSSYNNNSSRIKEYRQLYRGKYP